MRYLAKVFLCCLLAAFANAEDVYLIQGYAAGAPLAKSQTLVWSSETILMNRGTSDATIALRGISNGGLAGAQPSVTLPPGRSGVLQRLTQWRPLNTEPLWVVHLDVPSSVALENFLRIGVSTDFGGGLPGNTAPTALGKAPLPVIRRLVPPGEMQVHLGTDLGRDQTSRVNVAVYNAASAIASAHIELRSHCDDALLAARDVFVPADTLLQFTGFSVEIPACSSGVAGPESIYTTVTVDQPSFSFVSVLSRRETPLVSYAIAYTPQ